MDTWRRIRDNGLVRWSLAIFYIVAFLAVATFTILLIRGGWSYVQTTYPPFLSDLIKIAIRLHILLILIYGLIRFFEHRTYKNYFERRKRQGRSE
jgi:putative copper export protein